MNRPALVLVSIPLLALAAAAYAHNAICDCFDNGDETITCEGGFSDGAKAVGVPLRDIVLVTPGTLPKTSSGKLQRALCRSRYLSAQLQPI